ncbi:PINc/VapC family ATPase [Candidatus Woesearchaeota archaeon]|nr:PINc/VapC family ATPase [Candidatus Woesearchaeota archaeon]
MNAGKVVPDTSVIIEGVLSNQLKAKELTAKSIIFHEAVLAELEHQANQGRAIGFLGLDELDRIRELSDKQKFEISFSGTRPRAADIRHATIGEIDALVRELAYEEGATLVTADKVQARVAKAKGVDTLLVKLSGKVAKPKLDKYFDATTMSVHLRENVAAYAKKGVPGDWKFVQLGKNPLNQEDIQTIASDIIEQTGMRRDGFVELERPGSTIVQLGSYRIVITKPPFADGWEITAVRPVKRMSLADYKLTEKLLTRIGDQAEGVLIAGAPGMGKSTFAQALAEFYANKEKIVKTVEAPRDLVLPDSITQYAISHGTQQEVHDILLLSRPDYTIVDEMRNTDDFRLFADLRLAGIGLVGVVHATNPIDAIQRFVGRIELGVIPQVIDTVIFIKNGQVDKVLSLNMTVKVPSGMTEADLARPVVVVNDFETKRLEYELYSYGEETVVVPVKGKTDVAPARRIAAKEIEREFHKFSDDIQVEVVSDHQCIVYVPHKLIPKIIGRQGRSIERLEKLLGINIDVQELSAGSGGESLEFNTSITKQKVVLYVDQAHSGSSVDILVNDEHLLSANVGKNGVIKLSKKNKLVRLLQDAINMKENITVLLKQ